MEKKKKKTLVLKKKKKGLKRITHFKNAIWVLRILMEIPMDIYAHYLGCCENTTSL